MSLLKKREAPLANNLRTISSDAFKKNIQKIDSEEIRLLKLQKSLKNGVIKLKDLTIEEMQQLNNLYLKQNRLLKRTIENHKKKILEYRKQYLS